MPDNQEILILLYYLQAFLAVRYVAQAVFGRVPNYKFYKLLIVCFIPVIGYFLMMEKPAEVE